MKFDNAHVQTIDWMNEHGTFKQKGVERVLPIASPSRDLLEQWRRVGSVLMEVVGHAFANSEPLRPDGSRWSLSNIAQPHKLALSLAAHDVAEAVPENWRSATYRASLDQSKLVPMLVSGSMKIHRLNRVLALSDLALQTSGASDGQTLAGACATGTHGAAIRLGALHDTLRAVHLMVGPKEALLVQPADAPLEELAAKDLSAWFGFPTRLVSDDNLFRAAQVHLGALGLVLNAVVEARPMYVFTEVTTVHVTDAWKRALSEMDSRSITGHPKKPSYLQVIVNPYKPSPANGAVAWVISMTDQAFKNQRDVAIRPSAANPPNPDLLALVSDLAEFEDIGFGDLALRKFMTSELSARYGTKKKSRKALPGVVFGPSALPRGRGDSVEYVVDASQARQAAEAILFTLDQERKAGNQFLGALGIRFVKGSSALLAPNLRPVSCFLELPSVRSNELPRIYSSCGAALSAEGIPFGCHWGQHLVGIKQRLKTWWGEARTQAFRDARRALLSTGKARLVFASPVIKTAGLD